MRQRVGNHIRSNIVGYVALFASLTLSTAWALEKNSVGSKQLKPNAVKNSDLAANSVTGPKVADGSLGGEDFAAGELPGGQQGPAGARGATGPQGPQGVTGSPGTDGSPDTAAQVLAKLLTVDGAGSTLDADTLDGLQGSGFVQDADAVTCSPNDVSGTFANLDLCDNTVGAGELDSTSAYDGDQFAFGDSTVGGAATQSSLFLTNNYDVVAKCDQVTAGNFEASINISRLGAITTFSINSEASNGVDAVNLTATQDLIRVGPTNVANLESGDYSVIGFDSGGADVPALLGSVAAGVNLGATDCVFTAFGWSPNA